MAFTALGAVGRRVCALEAEVAVVIKVNALPVDSRVAVGAVVRLAELPVSRWITVAVIGVAAQTFGGGLLALDVTGVAIGRGVGVGQGEESAVVEGRAPPPRDGVTLFTVGGEARVTVDSGVGAVLVVGVAPRARPGRDRPVL